MHRAGDSLAEIDVLQRLPRDALYGRVSAFMKRTMEPPVFVAGLPDRR